MFRIDQTGLPTGVDDVSRTDGLLNGQPVVITYAGTGTFRARLLWVPPGDTDALSSLMELLPGGWTFTPTPNKPGSYRIQGIENEGKPNERRVERIFGVRTVAGILIPAFGEGCNQLAHLENATATHIAQSSNNATDFRDPALNNLAWSGWWRVWHEMALLAASVPPGSAPSWINDATPIVNWGEPTYIGLPTIDFTPNFGSGTLTVNLAAHRRLDHASVDCVLLEVPTVVTGGLALPTVEQADGVTMTTGQRCLCPHTAGRYGIYTHDGTKLVLASDNAAVTYGHRVYATMGRIYNRKAFTFVGTSPSNFGGPYWMCQNGPTWGAQRRITASGTAGWVQLLVVWLAYGATGSTFDVALCATRWSGTFANLRAFRGECTYVGDDTTVAPVPGMDPIVLHDVGETDVASRMRIEVSSGALIVYGYRDAAGGTTYDYRVEMTVVQNSLSASY